MREITQEVFDDIVNRVEAGPHPSEWPSEKATIYIDDDGRLIYQCIDVEDAERVLYAQLTILGV